MTSPAKFAPWLVAIVSLCVAAFIWQDSRARLKENDSEIAALKSQLGIVLLEANAKIAEANAKCKTLVEDANKIIQAANLKEVSVHIGFRKALLSSGNVAAFTNTSGQTIAISVEIERPSSVQRRTFSLTLDPGQTKEIGERDGWAFISQDIIIISQPEHKALRFVAP
jgi:hypothetical protein